MRRLAGIDDNSGPDRAQRIVPKLGLVVT